jgi:predicted ATPase
MGGVLAYDRDGGVAVVAPLEVERPQKQELREMRTLEKIEITNFKSIKEQSLELRPLNIMIGGNGSGKSNLIQAFRLLKEVVDKNLANYTAQHGGSDGLLHYGRKHSRELTIAVTFGAGRNTTNAYRLVLAPTNDDNLFITSEMVFFHDRTRYPNKPYDRTIASGARESQLRENTHISAQQVLQDLDGYRVYHFHDTSDSAEAKASSDLEDNRFLRSQAENLPAFLYLLQQSFPDHYRNIVETIRKIAPFFGDFRLQPSRLNQEKIRLEWVERGSDTYFNASSLSDGTLRFICLATLLLQPELPQLVLLDEPELGLHPAAIVLLAQLLSSASSRSQVLVATQSVTLVNQFSPDDVWTVEKKEGETTFRHLSDTDWSQWLDDYALGELWEKNLLGARP